jgi:hypothetical protein
MPFSLPYIAEYLQNHLSAPTCAKCRIYIQSLRVGIIANSTIQITGHCKLCGKYYTLYLPHTYSWWIRDSEDMKAVCKYLQKYLTQSFEHVLDSKVDITMENKPYGHIE